MITSEKELSLIILVHVLKGYFQKDQAETTPLRMALATVYDDFKSTLSSYEKAFRIPPHEANLGTRRLAQLINSTDLKKIVTLSIENGGELTILAPTDQIECVLVNVVVLSSLKHGESILKHLQSLKDEYHSISSESSDKKEPSLVDSEQILGAPQLGSTSTELHEEDASNASEMTEILENSSAVDTSASASAVDYMEIASKGTESNMDNSVSASVKHDVSVETEEMESPDTNEEEDEGEMEEHEKLDTNQETRSRSVADEAIPTESQAEINKTEDIALYQEDDQEEDGGLKREEVEDESVVELEQEYINDNELEDVGGDEDYEFEEEEVNEEVEEAVDDEEDTESAESSETEEIKDESPNVEDIQEIEDREDGAEKEVEKEEVETAENIGSTENTESTGSTGSTENTESTVNTESTENIKVSQQMQESTAHETTVSLQPIPDSSEKNEKEEVEREEKETQGVGSEYEIENLEAENLSLPEVKENEKPQVQDLEREKVRENEEVEKEKSEEATETHQEETVEEPPVVQSVPNDSMTLTQETKPEEISQETLQNVSEIVRPKPPQPQVAAEVAAGENAHGYSGADASAPGHKRALAEEATLPEIVDHVSKKARNFGPLTTEPKKSGFESGTEKPQLSTAQNYRRFQTIAINLMRSIEAHRYSSPFLATVTASNYTAVIKHRKNLKSIIKDIKKKQNLAVYSTVKELERDIILMFTNCVMFNRSSAPLVKMAQEMKEDVRNTFKMFEDAERAISQ